MSRTKSQFFEEINFSSENDDGQAWHHFQQEAEYYQSVIDQQQEVGDEI